MYVDALFRWGGKRVHCLVANIIRTIHTKFYQNWLSFVDDMTKTFWCVFVRFTVPIVVHLLNANAKFHKVV